MGYEVTGKIYLIGDTIQVSERFTKREFVVELNDNPKHPQLVQFQLTGDRCAQLDGLSVGEEISLEFSLRGREWKSPKGETKFFNSLDVWRVEGTRRCSDAASCEPPPPSNPDDDLPFATCSVGAEPSPIWRPFR